MYVSRSKWAWVGIGFVVIFIIMAATFGFYGFSSSTNYLPPKDNGYTITDYNVDINVNKDKTLNITEEISVNFLEASHGIYRYIPMQQEVSYKDKNGNIQQRNYRTKISDFKLYSSGVSVLSAVESDGYMFYQLGTNIHYISGEKIFKFSYDLNLGDDRDSIEDIFYFNIIGTGWDTSIANVDFTITYPTNIENQNFNFYVGRYATNYEGVDTRLTYTKSENTVSGNCINLKYGEAITTFTIFEEGYFKINKTLWKDILILSLTVVTFGLILLLFFTKRRKTPLVEVVEFKAPKDLTPTEVGYINDSKITGDDISSLIVYWASKGFVKLEAKSKDEVIITKLSALPSKSKSHEKIFFKEVFAKGDVVSSKSLSSITPETGLKCKTAVEATGKQYFDKKCDGMFSLLCLTAVLIVGFQIFKLISQSFLNGLTSVFLGVMAAMFAVAIMIYPQTIKLKDKLKKAKFVPLLILNLIFIFAPLVVISILTEGYIDVFFARIYLFILPLALTLVYPYLETYTKEGKEVLGQIRGLKRFILLAEKDRIEMLAHENPSAFYEIMPYAYVLGVSDVYMNKFKDIPIGENENFVYDPTLGWAFAMHSICSSINITANAVAATMRPNPPKTTGGSKGFGSGGFGGGGFSGGGFGGGGGGRF